ncbi:MAG TPA: chemotaxis response regulator protein-glutamate methylesterase [Elusimicrobia bacterium]|nr:chemotaxis response regulator protein-glutamate methylesterase [Elusimicrobiota bacterium]
MINVLIANDSPTAAEFLKRILSTDPEISVTDVARNGLEAANMAGRKRPDVIAMDIHMPGLDGFEATRRIMENTPVPIVIVAGSSSGDNEIMVFKAVQAGAVACVRAPSGFSSPEHAPEAAELVKTIKAMSEVKVIRRWHDLARRPAAAVPAPGQLPKLQPGMIQLVAMGASTGGPQVLQSILSRLPAGLSAPVVVVQHMSPGFIKSFARWLDGSTPLKVTIAAHGETALPGHVYVAPDGRHIAVRAGAEIQLTDDEPENGMRPSVSRLFRSLAGNLGEHSAGILLTGMGEDGAMELKNMRDAGAVTIAQDSESSLIYGMPGAAVKAGAAAYVLSPAGIAAAISALAPAKITGGAL